LPRTENRDSSDTRACDRDEEDPHSAEHCMTCDTPAVSMSVQDDRMRTDAGFEPAKNTVAKDTPVHLTFTRTSDKTCATEVLIPDEKINKDLPLNKPVTVDLTFKKDGEVTFMCGQKMMKGTILVQSS
jgi:plastocyanin domain-containing protein